MRVKEGRVHNRDYKGIDREEERKNTNVVRDAKEEFRQGGEYRQEVNEDKG